MKRLLLALAVFISGCTATTEIKEKKIDPRCLEKGESGRCRAFFPRFYFDQESGECKKFIWGGCGGTVPFETMQSCKDTCL
jgi:hypothetical protein